MWRTPASRKASRSPPRKKNNACARYANLTQKRIHHTCAWTPARRCYRTRNAGVGRLRRARNTEDCRFSCYLLLPPCYSSALVCRDGRSQSPAYTAQGCSDGAKALDEQKDSIVPRSWPALPDRGPESCRSRVSLFFPCSLQWAVAANRVCTAYRGLNGIAALAAALKCRGGSPHERVGRILPRCTARTSSASRVA